jgi:hypothetical protein
VPEAPQELRRHCLEVILRLFLATTMVAALSLFAAVSSVRGDGFGRARTVVPAMRNFLGAPAVAVNAEGRAVVAWGQSTRGRGGRLRARLGRVTGRLRRAHTLSRAPVYESAFAVGADGTAAALLVAAEPRGGLRRVLVALARPGHNFGRPQTLVEVRANITLGGITVNKERRIVAVWWQGVPGTGGHEVRYALRSPGQRFGRPRDLAAASEGGGASVILSPDGTTYVAWPTPFAEGNQEAAVAALGPSATSFGEPQIVSGQVAAETGSAGAEAPTLFGGPGGIALSYTVDGVQPRLLQIAPRRPDGRFAPPQTATSVDVSDGRTGYTAPAVALPASAPAVAVWSLIKTVSPEGSTPVTREVWGAAQGSAGNYQTPTRLSTPSALAQSPLAAAAGSTAIAVWGEGRNLLRLRYALRPQSGPLIAPRRLTRDRVNEPALAAAGRYAVAVWVARKGASRRAVHMAVLRAGGP